MTNEQYTAEVKRIRRAIKDRRVARMILKDLKQEYRARKWLRSRQSPGRVAVTQALDRGAKELEDVAKGQK